MYLWIYSSLKDLSAAREFRNICTVNCTRSNFILIVKMVFHDKIKKKGCYFYSSKFAWIEKQNWSQKKLDLNHCQGKIHLEVSVGNQIYKNRENVLWIILLICMAVKHTPSWWLWSSVSSITHVIDCLYRKTKEIFMKCNLIYLWNSYLWQCVWF